MSGNTKCPVCGKTVYFAERSTWEGKDYHAVCLIKAKNKEGGIHNKGYYGTTPQDPEVVFAKGGVAPPVNQPGARFCSNCGAAAKPGANFCAGCGKKL